MAEVTSKNCVGYMANALPEDTVSGTIDVGVSFSNVGVDGGAFTVSTSLLGTEVVDGDAVLIFNPNAYNYDWYQFAENYQGHPAWSIMDMATYETVFVNSFTVNDGDSLVYMGVAPEITVAGQVADLAGASRTFVIDLNSEDANDYMFPISNPYPIDTPASMLKDFCVDGDVLLVWNDAAYNYDWYQYYENYQGAPAWSVMDMESFETRFLTSPDDIILPAGHGAIFMPAVGGTRVWEVTLEK